MSTNWAEVAKNLAPIGAALIALMGIGFGARLSRRASTGSFLRERIFTEMERRRDAAVAYRKALWIFAGRVRKIRVLAKEAEDARKKGLKSSVTYDFAAEQVAHEKLLVAFAELEMRATVQVQIPARDCMEALATCFNYLSAMRMTEADASYAFFTQRYEVLSVELNNEADHFNAIIYSSFTSIWKAILGKARRKPLPYKALPPPIELRNSKERVVIHPDGDVDAQNVDIAADGDTT